MILQVREQEEWATKEQELSKEKEALKSELEVARSVLQSSGGSDGRKEEGWKVLVEFTTLVLGVGS